MDMNSKLYIELRNEFEQNEDLLTTKKDLLKDIKGFVNAMNSLEDSKIENFLLMQCKRNIGFKYKNID